MPFSFRCRYNHYRPHSACNGYPPIWHYDRPAARKILGQVFAINYQGRRQEFAGTYHYHKKRSTTVRRLPSLCRTVKADPVPKRVNSREFCRHRRVDRSRLGVCHSRRNDLVCPNTKPMGCSRSPHFWRARRLNRRQIVNHPMQLFPRQSQVHNLYPYFITSLWPQGFRVSQ